MVTFVAENDELPRDNEPLRRKSTRKRTKSAKLLSAMKGKGNFYVLNCDEGVGSLLPWKMLISC